MTINSAKGDVVKMEGRNKKNNSQQTKV